ncbi:TlpA disulfide reductase family protein [Mucilaginibacter gossypiicola]|nr:TlpA disulfide reductase family protein [Mucilaginibacter gossypiicola]
MKKLHITALLTFLSTCTFAQSSNGIFNITGHISNLNAGKIFIMYNSSAQQSIKDSCNILNGNFHFKGTVAGPVLGYLRLDNTNYVDKEAIYIYIEPSDIQAELSAGPFSAISISGSKSQDELMRWKNADLALKRKFINILSGESFKRKGIKKKAESDSLLLYEEQRALQTYAFVKGHLKSYVTPYLLNFFYRNYTRVQLQEVYAGLSDSVKNCTRGKELANHILQMKDNSKGGMAANLAGKDYVTNLDFDMVHLKGKYILVDFWGSWCQPCIALLPELIKEQQKYKRDDIVFMSVAVDEENNKAKCAGIVRSIGLNSINIWQNISDKSKDSIATIYDVGAYPTFILVDPTGKIVERGTGESGFLSCRVRLDELLPKN